MSDAKQGSQHISARYVNTSQGRIKLLITAKNVVSAGRWNKIHDEFCLRLFEWYACCPKEWRLGSYWPASELLTWVAVGTKNPGTICKARAKYSRREKCFIEECIKHPIATCFSKRNKSPTKYKFLLNYYCSLSSRSTMLISVSSKFVSLTNHVVLE